MNIDKDAETDDATAEPAKRIPGADFEPGPSSPLNEDGSLRWSARDAENRWAESQMREDELRARRKWEETW